jgi:hypothetical protein
MCDEPPPHEHHLGTILNARYYCLDGNRHQWGSPSRWLKRVHCTNCGERQPRSDRPGNVLAAMARHDERTGDKS